MPNRPTWHPNPRTTPQHIADEILSGPGGGMLARVQRRHGDSGFYPFATSARTGVTQLGEAWPDLAGAKAWAERVAGVRVEERS